MSEFIKFCPKCYTLFRDPDLYARHVAACGTAQKKETGVVKEPKKAAGKETADRRRQTAAEERSQNSGDRSQEMDENNSQTLEEESAAVCGLQTAVSAEGGQPPKRSHKFKS